MIIEYI